MQRTVLYDAHERLGARMGPFAGFDMPIQYEGIIREHQACRAGATLFDTCHMGELKIRGPAAVADLERLLTCRVGSLRRGRCRYGFMCNADGGVLDDLIVYRLEEAELMLVVNAANRDKDAQWIAAHLSDGSELDDISDQTAKIDLQGPGAPRIAQALMEASVADLAYFFFMPNRYRGAPLLLSRTGYTGEIGFEIYCDIALVPDLWDACRQAGAVPAGLGARDTLRIEAGLPLYGHELDEKRNAAESGFTKVIAADKDFLGSDAVRRQGAATHILAGFVLEGRRAARAGDRIEIEGREAGEITSGSFAPSLERAAALGYVHQVQHKIGRRVTIRTGRGDRHGTIERLPLYGRVTARAPMKAFLDGTK